MKKVWVYKRKGIKGWWVGWYENSQRRAKTLPTKPLAEHYRHIKYTQLNSDVFTGIVVADWLQMTEDYYKYKTVEGITESSLYDILLTLRNFQRLMNIKSSKQLTQNNIDEYILKRGTEVKRATLNKDIRNMKAFIRWCRDHRYLNGKVKIKELKEDEKPIKSLSNIQVKNLLKAAGPYQSMKLRILLALGTGLRRGDIETLKISDINFENNSITTASKKTRKSMGARPIPGVVMAEIKKCLNGSNNGQAKLINDNFNQKKWKTICCNAGLNDLKFHDLRRTFASALAQNGVSTAVTQRLLEHSSSTLTNKIYTNVDPVLRQSVNQLPISQWLSK